MLERKVYNKKNDDITLFSIITFGKPKYDMCCQIAYVIKGLHCSDLLSMLPSG